MTDTQRTAWLAGQWIAIRPAASLVWLVRRQEQGKVETHGLTFPNEWLAQKYADKLNQKEATK